jgi:ribose/xylose/arabinose/galactoside ABC-type transport system permease subunit
MKVAIGFLIAGILLLVLFFLNADIWFRDKSVDLHIHDTYFVIDRLHFVLAVLLFLLTVFALGGVIGTRLKSKSFLVTLLVAFTLNGLAVWWVYRQFN